MPCLCFLPGRQLPLFSRHKALLLLHDFTQSHRALESWGSTLVGKGAPIDPSQHWVVSANLLGSPFGSTSAAMLQSEQGDPYAFTIEDMARAAAGARRRNARGARGARGGRGRLCGGRQL